MKKHLSKKRLSITLEPGKSVYAMDIHGVSNGTYIIKAYSKDCHNCFDKLLQIIK